MLAHRFGNDGQTLVIIPRDARLPHREKTSVKQTIIHFSVLPLSGL